MNYKRLIWITLLISAGSMLLMGHLKAQATGPRPDESQPSVAAQPDEIKPPRPTATTKRKPSSQIRWPVSKRPAHEVVLGSTDKKTGFKFQVKLTSLGAAVREIRLTDYFMTVGDKRCYEKDPDNYAKALKQDSKLKGHYVLVKPVGPGDKKTCPMATRRITIIADGERIPLDLSGPRWSAGEVQIKKDSEGNIQGQSVTFSTTIYRNTVKEPFLLLKKTYTLQAGSYSIGVRLEAENRRKIGKAEFSLTQYSAVGVPKEDTRSDSRSLVYGLAEGENVKVESVPVKDSSDVAVGLGNAKKLGRSDGAKPVLWIGQTNKFFAALTYIIPKDVENTAAPQAQAGFFGAVVSESGKSKPLLAGINLGPYELAPGGSRDVNLDLFAGPKKRDLFDDTPLYKKLGYDRTMHFRSCCTMCAFEWLSLKMMWLLDFFKNSIAFHNYGVAIILLVILVRICLHPLMKKQQVSMMRMQKLAPEMEKVKQKYADDKTKLNAEMMKLYKEQGATPLLGCLPMLLQMPILIALWTSINASVELRHAAFLPVWIIDLAAPDGLIPFAGSGIDIPLIGSMIGPITGFNLLPLLLCVVMYLQMKMNPQMSGASASPQQQSSQTMMKFMMPGMMLVFFYNAASGLTLYFMTSTFAGLVEQYVIRKHIREKEETQAAAETTVSMPGKRFRGQKPKKPKGPFQVR